LAGSAVIANSRKRFAISYDLIDTDNFISSKDENNPGADYDKFPLLDAPPAN
jgi:hypothetical protein